MSDVCFGRVLEGILEHSGSSSGRPGAILKTVLGSQTSLVLPHQSEVAVQSGLQIE